MDLETRELLADVLEALAATVVAMQLALDRNPDPMVDRGLKRANGLLQKAREHLRTLGDATANTSIRDAILLEYATAGAPYGLTRRGLGRWLGETLGVQVSAKQLKAAR